MIGKKHFFFATLILLPFLYLFSAWGWAQQGGGGGGGGSSGGGSTTSGGQRSAERQRPMYLSGQVLLDDGQEPGQQVKIELNCQGTMIRQEFTSHNGMFSLEISRGGSTEDTLRPMDASASTSSYSPVDGRISSGSQGSGALSSATIQRRQVDLSACDLTARLQGYQSDVLRLGRRRALDSPDIGVILLHNLEGSAGGTISLKTLAAPKKAKEAYEKAGKEFTKEHPDYSKMAKELEKAIDIYPQFASAWYLLGEIRLKQNDRPSAAKAFEEAKAADPAYVNPYLSLAFMALEEERWQEAVDLSGQTLEMNPQLTKAHYYTALANSSLGHVDDAESSALLVLKHNQAQIYPLIYYVLGSAEAQRGNFPSAAARFRSFLEIQPSLSLSGKLKEQLALWQKQGLIQ